MSFRKSFVYVDIHSSAQGLRQWKRVRIDQVEDKLLKPSKYYRCFKSVQMYQKPTAEAGEKVWMPLFFDLDSNDGPEKAIGDLRKLYSYLHEFLEIPDAYIHVYFSGKKGFHLIVEPEIFGINPDKDVHLKVKRAAMDVAELLKLETFDSSVYSKRRVLRVAGSIHEGTKLYKIELLFAEVLNGIEWIKKQADKPRKPPWPEDDDLPEIENAAAFWNEVTSNVEEAKELSNLNPSHLITAFGDLPVCMKHLLALTELPTSNSGNRTILSMASYLKDAGKTLQEAVDVIVPWALKLTNIGWAKEPDKLAPAVTATIKFVYDKGEQQNDEPYHFACKYILGLSTAEHKVPCQGLECPAIKGKAQKTKEVIDLELPQFSRSIYLGEKVRVPTLVSGKAGTPYVVPKRIRFNCQPDEKGEFCDSCPMARFNGEASFEFSGQDTEILEVVNTTNAKQWEAIRRRFRIPSACRRNRGRVEENMNVEEVRMSPAAVDIQNFEKNEFVSRRGFYIGYPLPSNKRYKLTGYPVKDPKTQASAFLFEEKEKLETDVETFKMTKEIHDELSIFQAKEADVEGKWSEIHQDLAHNVTRIWNRQETAWAIDLVAHSVRGFRFRSEPFVKGWVELLRVGDCLHPETRIWTNKGFVKVSEIVKDAKLGWNEPDQSLQAWDPCEKRWVKIGGVFKKERSKMRSITLSDGTSFCATPEHGIMMSSGMKQMKDVIAGDRVAVPRSISPIENIKGARAEIEARFLGYMVGDGSFVGKNMPSLSSGHEDVGKIKDFRRCLRKLGFLDTTHGKNKKRALSIVVRPRPKVAKLFEKWGACRVTAPFKRTPERVFSGSRGVIRAYLQALFECDGTNYSKHFDQVSLCSSSENLVRETQQLLRVFSIRSILKKTMKRSQDMAEKRNYWILKIEGSDNYHRFLDEVGFVSPRKNARGKRRVANSNVDVIPVDRKAVDLLWKMFLEWRPEIRKRGVNRVDGVSINTIRQVRYGVRYFTKRTLLEFLHLTRSLSTEPEWQEMNDLFDNDFIWPKVVSCVDEPDSVAFDVFVESETHTTATSIVSHNSGQGKTSIVRRLVQGHYRVGEIISGSSARRTGLLYSYQENGKTWMLIWGALPLNDLGLIVLDEFGDLPEDQFAVMTDVRSSGIVKAVGVVTAETYARVRLIALSNPKKGKHLAEYDCPVMALKELVPAAEDIRRFDFACAVASGEVATETINQADFEDVPHVYTQHLCSNLIRWTWSRKESDVVFEDKASRLILSEATRMAKDYYAGAIPLCEPADQRFKLARLSAAAAARVFSTDETGEKLIIKEEHVGFVSGLLMHLYGHPNFKYSEWSRQQKSTDVSESVDLESSLDKLMRLPNWKKVFGLLMLQGQVEGREMENAMGGERKDSLAALATLRLLGLLEKKHSKYNKTAKCNQLVNWAISKKKVDKEEIERSMMGDDQVNPNEWKNMPTKDRADSD